MTLRIKRTYTCNHCGKEGSNVSSELMLPEWFHVQLIPSVLYGCASGDYCSLECVHEALQQAVENILEAIRGEINCKQISENL